MNCVRLVPILLVLAVAWPAAAQSAAPERVWAGDEVGVARQITLALDAGHVYLAETGLVTVIDRATGTTTEVPVRTPDGDYLPVQGAIVHEGSLWLAVGNGTRGSRPRLLEIEGGRVHERARLAAWGCSLASSGGELFWSDRQHVRRWAHGRVRTVATAPAGGYFETDCRTPLAVDDAHVYVTLGTASDPTAPTPLLAYPRHGGTATTLDPDVHLRVPIVVSGSLVLAYAVGASEDVERLDLATGARSVLVPTATVSVASADGTGLVWLDGNFYGHDPWRIRRVDPTTGATATLYEGDVRAPHGVVADGDAIFALVAHHPEGECAVVHRAMEPGDHTITRCAQPDLQLFRLAGRTP